MTRNDGLAGADPASLARQRVLVESLGGTYHQVRRRRRRRAALLDFARGVNATQLVLGASRRGRFAQLLRPGVGRRPPPRCPGRSTCTWSPTTQAGRGPAARPALPAALSRRRRLLGFALAGLGLPLLTAGAVARCADS